MSRIVWTAIALILTSNAHADWFVTRSFSRNVYLSTGGSSCGGFRGYIDAGTSPSLIAISPNGRNLYVTSHQAADPITAIDTQTRARRTFNGGSSISAIAASNTRVYVVGGSALRVIDAASGAMTQVFLPGDAYRVKTNNAGTRVFASTGSMLVEVDAATNAILGTHSASGPIGDIAISPDDSRLYFTNMSTLAIEVMDLSDRTIVGNYPLGPLPAGAAPWRLRINPQGTRLYSLVSVAVNGVAQPGRLIAVDLPSGNVAGQRTTDSSSMDLAVNRTQVLVSQYNSVEPPGSEPSTYGMVMVYDSSSLVDVEETRIGGHPYDIVAWDPPPPATLANVEITGVEVTQGLQDLNHTVRLVQGKRTAVRVYARTSDPLNTPPVTVYLYGVRQACGGGACEDQPLSMLAPSLPKGGALKLEATPWREVLEDSFVFTLPPEWTSSAAALRLFPVAQTAGGPVPACNSTGAMAQVNFALGTGLDIQFVLMQWFRNGVLSATRQDFAKATSLLERMFPLSDLSFRDPLTIRDDSLIGTVPHLADECDDLDDLDARRPAPRDR